VDEIPAELCDVQGRRSRRAEQELYNTPGEVDLYAERSYVRESVRFTTDQIRQSRTLRPNAPAPRPGGSPPNSYPGKSYNSVENIAEFFKERGLPVPGGQTAPPKPPQPKPAPVVPMPMVRPVTPPLGIAKKKKTGEGSTVNHPKYGRGTVVRKEGDGEDAKLTVIFPGYGMKKLIAKYAGIKIDE
jgi:DNA helicase-2/ATP-dependent DNA helicase PcrA